MTPEELTLTVKSQALGLGFHRVGVARAEPLEHDWEAFNNYLSRGYQGEMHWLEREPEVRRSVASSAVLEGALSVLVCAAVYHRGDEPALVEGATVARYARGRDYHNFVRKRLRKLAVWMRTSFGAKARALVDTGPILEKAWARRAGLGFVGKNGLVITPGLSSWMILGEVVTDLALVADVPIEERCGSCTRCLDACPTSAFVAPWVLDARKCISYLTIELEGPVERELRAKMGDKLFGCDDCQTVCPYNRTGAPARETTAEFASDQRFEGLKVSDILSLDQDGFVKLTQGSPLARAGREGLARNAATVLGNTGTREHLSALSLSAQSDPDETVRQTAVWAIEAIEKRHPPRE